MKKFDSALVFLLICLAVYAAFFLFFNHFSLLGMPLVNLLSGFILLFTILGVTYNNLWTINSFKKRPFISTAVTVLTLVILIVFSKISIQAFQIFKHLAVREGKHWDGNVFQSDPVLGHIPVKCASGSLELEYNHTLLHHIPMKYDENGFRIGADTSCERQLKRPLVLFLGCSFTEGADCAAEKTFSAIVGDSLHGSSLNAGVSSYGFSQMLLLARALIPKFKPDYVVVQNSPWLSERAVSRYAPTFGLAIPSPYFASVHDSLQIEPPVFPTDCFSLTWKYDHSKSGLRNFLSFYFKEGFRVCARDWKETLTAALKTPRPIKNQEAVQKAFFSEIVQLSEQNNNKLIVVNLGDIRTTGNSRKLVSDKNVRFAEADSLLWDNAGFKEKKYEQLYYHRAWTGTDSVIVDMHPTVAAHAIIANSILKTINF